MVPLLAAAQALAEAFQVIVSSDATADTITDSEPSTSTSKGTCAYVECPGGDTSAKGESEAQMPQVAPTGKGLPRFDNSTRGTHVNVMIPRGTAVQSAKDRALEDPLKANFTLSFAATEGYQIGGIISSSPPPHAKNSSADGDAQSSSHERVESPTSSSLFEEKDKITLELFQHNAILEERVAVLTEQSDRLREENSTLYLNLKASQTSQQDLLSEHKRLDISLHSLTPEISARKSETETLQRIIVELKQEAAKTLAGRDATIQQLMTKCSELENLKKLVDNSAQHAREIEALKVKYDEAVRSHQRDMEAAMRNTAFLEEEIQQLKASLKDFEARAEETEVEPEAVEINDKRRAHTGSGKRNLDDLDNVATPGKRSRPGTESTPSRGRSTVRSIRRIIKSISRTGTPEKEGVKDERGGRAKQIAEYGIRETSKGIERLSEDGVNSSPRLPKTPNNKTLCPLESIGASTSTASSNNADDDATVIGTPVITKNKIDDDEYVFLESSTAISDPKTLNGRIGLSHEPPLRPSLKVPPEGGSVSPTPVREHPKRHSSPFSSPSRRPAHAPHAATDPPRATSPLVLSRPLEALRRATSPIRQATSVSSSKKRKQEESEERYEPDIKSWYADGGPERRMAKRNKTHKHGS